MKPSEAMKEAISKAGGATALAKELNISRPAVSQWKRVPFRHVLAVEKITGVPKETLAPEIYPDAETMQKEIA